MQAIEDYEQLRRMGYEDKVHIIPPTLKAYNSVLENLDAVDYIGTRLHGGIHVHMQKCLSCITEKSYYKFDGTSAANPYADERCNAGKMF